MVGMVNGTFLTKEEPGVGNNTQRNRKPQEEETLVLGDDLWKILGMQWDWRTLVNRGIQITTKLGKNKDWIRRGLDKGRLGLQQIVFWRPQLERCRSRHVMTCWKPEGTRLK